MKWLHDDTGRLGQRPHYERSELDAMCEELVVAFLRAKYGTARYPIETNDLTILLEQRVGVLDLYADLSGDGDGIEGVTDFIPGQKPDVRVAATLSEDARRENRYRTTLTHELGHVHLHTSLMGQALPLPLFGDAEPAPARCHRDRMVGMGRVDWLEWQAGYASGAFLMPHSEVREMVWNLREAIGGLRAISPGTPAGQSLLRAIQERFEVSADAARVRLLKLGYFIEAAPIHSLLT